MYTTLITITGNLRSSQKSERYIREANLATHQVNPHKQQNNTQLTLQLPIASLQLSKPATMLFGDEMDLVVMTRLENMMEIINEECYQLCGLSLSVMINDIARNLYSEIKMLQKHLHIWGASPRQLEKYHELMLTISVMMRRIHNNDVDGTVWCIRDVEKTLCKWMLPMFPNNITYIPNKRTIGYICSSSNDSDCYGFVNDDDMDCMDSLHSLDTDCSGSDCLLSSYASFGFRAQPSLPFKPLAGQVYAPKLF